MDFKTGDVVKCLRCAHTHDNRKGEWCVGRLGRRQKMRADGDPLLEIRVILMNEREEQDDGCCAFWPEYCTKLKAREYLQYLL